MTDDGVHGPDDEAPLPPEPPELDGPDEAELAEIMRAPDPLEEYDRRGYGSGPPLVDDREAALELAEALTDIWRNRTPSIELGDGPRWLDVIDVDELAQRAAKRPPAYLVDELWPSDAYGVIGAEDKAGKTWAMLDLAVSVATGTPWLGLFSVDRGRVFLMLGEGGERGLHRKLEAVCAGRGVELDDLLGWLRITTRVPHLTNRQHMAEVRAELEVYPAELSMLDPLYLAAAGAKGADLYAMGALLSELQHATEPGALVVSTHFAKTGKGAGPDRLTGVGPGAWGRVLATAEKTSWRTEPDGASVVELAWRFTGGEIADKGFAISRRVWADDVHDLGSALHYEVEALEGEVPVRIGPKLRPSAERVLHLIRRDERVTVREIGDRLAASGKPFRPSTITAALRSLLEAGYVDSEHDALPGMPVLWWLV